MKNNSVFNIEHNACCGCKACGDVCPKDAINFQLDNEGFYYPIVNDSCVNCGICSKVCPALNSSDGAQPFKQQYVGCLDKNPYRRETGSSGGIFGLLASHFLSMGYKICGAAFDEQLTLRHVIVDDENGVSVLKKAKYLQSDCRNIYESIKTIQKRGGKVMFVGTPCQCAALKRYLGGNNLNILFVDLVCHGVPSQDLFDKCIHYYEERNQCKVIDYSFRYKTKRYGPPKNFRLLLKKNGTIREKKGGYYEEPFYCGFQKHITLRPSCYECKWASTERVGDITLADFWGIEKITDKWDRTNHPSLVILNTMKGQEAFNQIKPHIDYLFTTREMAIRRNGCLVRPTKKTEARKLFYNDLETLPFAEVVKRHLSDKHTIMKKIYYAVPFSIRKLILKVTNKL